MIKMIATDMDGTFLDSEKRFDPEFIDILEKGFEDFLQSLESADLKTEYLLPTIIGDLLKDKQISVEVLKSQDEWFGVTYKEDKESVKESIHKLIDKGVYPYSL